LETFDLAHRTQISSDFALMISPELGTAYMSQLALALRASIDADLIFIARPDGHPVRHLSALVVHEDGTPSERFSYEAAETPCREVYDGQAVSIPCAVARAFPAEAGYEGYLGMPINGPNDEVIGHIAVLSRNPIPDPSAALETLKLAARRIELDEHAKIDAAERECLIRELQDQGARLERRHRELHAANEFKTRLLGMIAHDLRNPLTAILSQVELLEKLIARDSSDQDRLLGRCQKISATADLMSGLITRTLDQVRSDTKSLTPEPRRTDLRTLVQNVADLNIERAMHKGITLDVTPSEIRYVHVDPDLLLEALDNLVNNAVKYTQKGGSVSLSVSKNRDILAFRIADTGQGLSPSDLRCLFQRFQTVSSKPTDGEVSLGLGLANVEEIVSALGGTVSAESDGKGKGSTFRILLPFHPAKSYTIHAMQGSAE
ncbi:MAG: HAMP domain-containing sensor histidine kinase, partial [Pseudomonadota bacterium]